MAEVLLEVCVETPAGLAAAVAGGADRIELCAALALGGLTPSPGMMSAAVAARVPVHALIRPRGGGFVYDRAEVGGMLGDILAARAAGLDGVVIGAALPDGRLDIGALREMVAVAGPMAVTLHRVFDYVPDWAEALESAIKLGIGRILTAGGKTTASAGIARLAALFDHAGGRILILPAGRIRADTVEALQERLPLREVHAACGNAGPEQPGFGAEWHTDRAAVRALKARLMA